ncbi:MAG: nucleoside triphosphate pyrophosphohydrolase, partial [Deltaproteobacteria bacterium]|nr:nucleoside triphosphate pyrophosphohydrolase [Deltaproteobacteria bacterium]
MDPDRLLKAVTGLVDLVEKLRGPGGCPWDAKQTDATIKLYLLEEAYEVLDAIEKTSPPDVCEELGDLLFHIFFLARLAEERKEFDFSEVVEKITEKMIRRHPHVFGNTTVDSADDVAVN